MRNAMPDKRQNNPVAFLEQVGIGKTITVYKPGEVIHKQGAPSDEVFYLQQGKAKETVMSEQGKEAVIGMLEPGEFFGCGPRLGPGSLRRSTVIAVTTCTVTTITIAALKKALHESKFAELFTACLLERASKIEGEKIDLLFNSSEKRLALKLLVLAHIDEGTAQLIGPEITQEMLADMIGTTRPRVNYFLNQFRTKGLIQYNGGIKVLPALLTAVLGDNGFKGKKENA